MRDRLPTNPPRSHPLPLFPRFPRLALPHCRLTYHSAVLLEWDHGRHCTVVELATLNGVGGRRGKSNWLHDGMYDSHSVSRLSVATQCSDSV